MSPSFHDATLLHEHPAFHNGTSRSKLALSVDALEREREEILENIASSRAMAAAHRAPANGVLPVSANQTAGNAPKPATKLPVPRLKAIVRRLPPGLTEAEFASILGDEWNLAQGKVDWFLYKPGKDSKEYMLPFQHPTQI